MKYIEMARKRNPQDSTKIKKFQKEKEKLMTRRKKKSRLGIGQQANSTAQITETGLK